MIKKSVYLGVILLFLSTVISCEKDFQDIGTSIINNGVFTTKDTVLEITITPEDLEAVRADGLGTTTSGVASLGEYLLGVYKNVEHKKVEASIVSQLNFVSSLKVVDDTYEPDTTVVTKMDKVFLRLPYQATKLDNDDDGKPVYRFDSILGNPTIPVNVKVYRNETFLNSLDPTDPTKSNEYQSDATYAQGELLNEAADFSFTVPQFSDTKDSLYVFQRHLSNGEVYNDTIKETGASPFMVIPLDVDKFKTMFLDEYEGANFATRDAFNNYFRGLQIVAEGDDGSMVPFNFSSDAPSLEIHYTNTILDSGVIIDTIAKNNSFSLSGIRNSIYKVTAAENAPASGDFVAQGTAGTGAGISILQGDQLAELRAKEWLINDASLIFYIDQSKDTTNIPSRLFLYKNNGTDDEGKPNLSQIGDVISEGPDTFGGFLGLDSDGKKDKYHFRITNYISDLLNGTSTYNPPLGLRVYNITNIPSLTTDTIVDTYNWDPRAVTLHSNTSTNTARKAQLKISYTVKND